MTAYTLSRAMTRRGLILVVLAGIFWGTSGVATKTIYSLVDVSPMTVAAFRLALGAPLLLAAFRWSGGVSRRVTNRVTARVSQRVTARVSQRLTRHDLGRLLVVGSALGISQACYFGAIARLGVAVATLVTICTAPILLSLLGAVLLRERLARITTAALAVALIGTALLVGGQGGAATAQGSAALTGLLLALAAAVCFGVFILGSRSLAGRYHPLQSITIAVAIGAGLLLIISAFTTGVQLTYPLPVWALFLYLGLAPTALAYGLFFHGVEHATAAEASIASLAEPLTSTVLAVAFFGERLSLLGWLGALLLIGVLAFLVLNGQSKSAGTEPMVQ